MKVPLQDSKCTVDIQLHPESSHANTTERETEREKEKCWFTLFLESLPLFKYHFNILQ